jgi:hypothetical protein
MLQNNRIDSFPSAAKRMSVSGYMIISAGYLDKISKNIARRPKPKVSPPAVAPDANITGEGAGIEAF